MREIPLQSHRRGFTLVELLIVLAIIATIATIALPYLLSSKVSANEGATLGTMRLIRQAQVQFITSGVADVNSNGAGEFGTFGEMSGNIPVRANNGGTNQLKPTLVSPAFRAISPLGEIVRGGYYYRLYLPGAGGEGILELAGGGAAANIDPRRAESTWCLYAWPATVGTTGRRAYFTSHAGGITYTESPTYSGPGAPIAPGAAFDAGGAINNIEGKPASNAVGRDGNFWHTLSN